MDNFPQPRPPMYGNRDREVKAQTLTEPRRVGPPRYPPAPPTLGDEDSPFPPPSPAPKYFYLPPPNTKLLVALYTVTILWTLGQFTLGMAGVINPGVNGVVLLIEVGIDLLAMAGLYSLQRSYYRPIQALVALHMLLAIIFAQWLSPAFWMAIVVAIYLQRPSIVSRYTGPQQAVYVDGLTNAELLHTRRGDWYSR